MVDCESVVFVTARLPHEALYLELLGRRDSWEEAGLKSVKAVGDAFSPGSIAAAIWDGRRFAEDLGRVDDDPWFPRDMVVV